MSQAFHSQYGCMLTLLYLCYNSIKYDLVGHAHAFEMLFKPLFMKENLKL